MGLVAALRSWVPAAADVDAIHPVRAINGE
jgi:hypothetical protein